DGPSQGVRTVTAGLPRWSLALAMLRKKAASVRDIWEGPSAARVMPMWVPTNLRLAPPMMAISTWSKAREKNLLKVEMKGILPPEERPAPTETMFCSAMRHSRKWPEWFLAKSME